MNAAQAFYQKYFYVLVPALLLVFYFYATNDLLIQNQRLKDQLVEQHKLLDMMVQNADFLRSNKSSTDSQKTITTVEALSHLEQVIKKHKIDDQLDNLRPLDNSSIRLWMKGVSFNDFIKMLAELTSQYPLLPVEYHIYSQPEPGRVDLDITLGIAS